MDKNTNVSNAKYGLLWNKNKMLLNSAMYNHTITGLFSDISCLGDADFEMGQNSPRSTSSAAYSFRR